MATQHGQMHARSTYLPAVLLLAGLACTITAAHLAVDHARADSSNDGAVMLQGDRRKEARLHGGLEPARWKIGQDMHGYCMCDLAFGAQASGMG